MRPSLHPLVTALLPAVTERLATAVADREFDDEVRRLDKVWAAIPLRHARGPVDRMGMVPELEATLALADDNSAALASSFRNAVAFRCMAFRWLAFVRPPEIGANVHTSAWDTVKVAGPTILGEWDEARTCAEALIIAAHIEQEHTHPEVHAQYWGKGTVDALLIYLLSAAFGIPTHYKPVNPVVPPYRDLLEHWRTADEAQFRKTMHAAAEFHLACCGDSDDDVRYEFDWFFEQIFPLELLAIQALRRRDGLPAFDTGHALIDAPWTMLRELPQAPLHPLTARVDARLRQDYPSYR